MLVNVDDFSDRLESSEVGFKKKVIIIIIIIIIIMGEIRNISIIR